MSKRLDNKMSICKSCGGEIGVDCFNPRECEEICYKQEQYDNHQNKSELETLKYEISRLIEMIETNNIEKEEILKNLKSLIRYE